MRGRTAHSIPPEPTGPTDDRVVYLVTDAGRQALANRVIDLTPRLEVALEEVERRQRHRQRAERAKAKGRRSGIVNDEQRSKGWIPALRLRGRWLAKAGFDIGQAYEVEVQDGRLVILAV